MCPGSAAAARAAESAGRGDNGSAFFFRLPSRAKSAMAEILVSDLCDLSPAATHRRVFSLPRGARSPGAFAFGLFPPVFLPVLYCFVPIAFFLAIARSYIVFLQIFAL
jgi:hypothetical protein